jgi:hypothetical protein
MPYVKPRSKGENYQNYKNYEYIKIKKYEWPKVQLKRSLSKEHQRLRQTHTGKLNDFYTFCYHFGWFMVLNATFNNISVIQLYWWRKLPTCRKSLTHFIT